MDTWTQTLLTFAEVVMLWNVLPGGVWTLLVLFMPPPHPPTPERFRCSVANRISLLILCEMRQALNHLPCISPRTHSCSQGVIWGKCGYLGWVNSNGVWAAYLSFLNFLFQSKKARQTHGLTSGRVCPRTKIYLQLFVCFKRPCCYCVPFTPLEIY